MLRCSGPIAVGCWDNENLEGLGGTRSGVPGILSEDDLSSEESTASSKSNQSDK